MLNAVLNTLSAVRERVDKWRLRRRWARLRALGMSIGQGVNLPASTWIDISHCYLIAIGDWCGFGEECMLLAHDAQFDEFLDAGRIGRVTIHPHSHIGARSIVLPGVEIGPYTIVGAHSVVSRSLPPNTMCTGAPAKVVCTLDEYLQKHRDRMATRPSFSYADYDLAALTPERRAQLVAAVAAGDVYLTGGWSATMRGTGGMYTTPFDPAQHPLVKGDGHPPA